MSNIIYERLNKPSRLYIKECPHCGLKYFGKSIVENIEEYTGSGIYWKSHLSKHKVKPTHLWHSDWYVDESIVRFATKFSYINNIVESKSWANLAIENGTAGGSLGPEIDKLKSNPGSKNGMYGKTHTTEVKDKLGDLAIERFKDKSYIELYGEKKASELKEHKSIKRKQYMKEHNISMKGANNTNAKICIVESPDGIVYTIEGALKQFCKDNDLPYSSIRDCAAGKREMYKGWKAKYE